jgi:hypothetical protein
MNKKTPFRRALDNVPSWIKRLGRFILSPGIPTGAVEATPLSHALADLLFATAAVFGVLYVGSSLLPDLLSFDLSTIFNWPLLAVLLFMTALIFGAILNALLWLPLWLKEKSWHRQIFFHMLRVFAVQNILVAALFVFGVNRVIVTGSPIAPTGSIEKWFVVGVAAIGLGLTLWLLVWPVVRYLKNYFHGLVAYTIGPVAVVATAVLNPILFADYFGNIVRANEFCLATVSVRFERELATGDFTKDCLIGQCLAAGAKETSARN